MTCKYLSTLSNIFFPCDFSHLYHRLVLAGQLTGLVHKHCQESDVWFPQKVKGTNSGKGHHIQNQHDGIQLLLILPQGKYYVWPMLTIVNKPKDIPKSVFGIRVAVTTQLALYPLNATHTQEKNGARLLNMCTSASLYAVFTDRKQWAE